jgi:surface antigen
MLEYAALTSSDPGELARLMTERSAQGWEILQIVSTGSQVTAFVRRAAIAGTTTPAASTTTATTASTTASFPSTASTQASTPVYTATQTSTQPNTASSVGDATAPAAWYPDPSGRYELRYWNGSAWTEHVSRNGQQFTDPPVA